MTDTLTAPSETASAVALLDHVTETRPGGQRREGQRRMASAVEAALTSRRHLITEGPCGTGKGYSYLIPAILHAKRTGKPVVVATATKALQEQLVTKDLPALAAALEPLIGEVRYAMLKGRSNYLCVARTAEKVDELFGGGDASLFDNPSAAPPDDPDAAAYGELAWWAWHTPTGDRADLPHVVDDRVWRNASVDARECAGKQCKMLEHCFPERAKLAAQSAHIVVVNTHLATLNLTVGGRILPAHDTVVFDEAHGLEDIAAGALGVEIRPGRLTALGGQVGRLVAGAESVTLLSEASETLREVLARLDGKAVDPSDGELADALRSCSGAVATARLDMRGVSATDDTVASRKDIAGKAAQSLHQDLTSVAAKTADEVAWVEPSGRTHALKVVPVDVGPLLRELLFDRYTVVLTSATLRVGASYHALARAVGLRDAPVPDVSAADGTDTVDKAIRALPRRFPARPRTDEDGRQLPTGAGGDAVTLTVGTPFDFRRQSMLYAPAGMPDPRDDGFLDAMTDELVPLIDAARGATLSLFTSYKAMRECAEQVRRRVPYEILTQEDLPRGALIRRFLDEPETCLFATMGFWAGIDPIGDTCRLVTVDKLPFSRPDDPLVNARRQAAERRGGNGFRDIDLPRVCILLAQGVGRLIRAIDDTGVAAVFDPRLVEVRDKRTGRMKASAYGRDTIVPSLPPMRRTRKREDVVGFLRESRREPGGVLS